VDVVLFIAQVTAMAFVPVAQLVLLDRWIARLRRRPPVLRVRRRRRLPRVPRLRRPPPVPVHRPLEVVAADLRRLSAQLAAVPAGATLVRWRALWSAFDDVLAEAAEQLEVPHELAATPVGPARDIERLRVVAALEAGGLVVTG
jgi:hypothetical protein